MIRLLLFACFCAALGGFASALDSDRYLGWHLGLNHKSFASTKNDTCHTKPCKMMAQIIKESMDDKADPCDDFYEYACGNFSNNHPIPKGRRSWSLWASVQDNVYKQIKAVLAEEIHKTDLMPIKLAKKWFKVCIDRNAMNRRGLDSVLLTLSRSGGWPLIMEEGEWAEELNRWQLIDDNYALLTAQSTFFDIIVVDLSEEDMGIVTAIHTPHFPSRTYKLFDGKRPHDEDDKSNEDNDNDEEDSQEKGSSSNEDGSKDIHRRKQVSKSAKSVEKKVMKIDKMRKHEVHRKKADHPDGVKSKGNKHNSIHKRTKRGLESHIHRAINRKRHPGKIYKPHQLNKLNKILTNAWKKQHVSVHAKKTHKIPKAVENTEDEDDDGEEKNDSKNDNNNETTTESSDADDSNSDKVDSDEVAAKEQRKKYAEYVLKVAEILAAVKGSVIPREKLVKDIEAMIDFQVNLYKLTFADDGYENCTLREIQELYDSTEPQTADGQVNWMEKIQRRFMEAGVVLDADKEIIITISKYLKGLRALLDETPTETIVNYIHWNMVSELIIGTTDELRELTANWTEKSWESQAEWENMCIRHIEMSDIVGYEYVRQYFSDDILQTAIDMIDEIQKEVEYQVKESTWIDEDTKDFIFDKLVNMKKLVGYPNWYRNETIVKQCYRGLLLGNSYIENLVNYKRYSKWKEMRLLIEENTYNEWFVDPVTLDAFFMPTQNSITLTAADFQFPLFSFDRPQGINFGIIGVIMAHEVNHGIDNIGHLYDKSGKVVEWLTAMADAYNQRVECFIDQFNGYSVVKGENATYKNYGNQTAGENIADTMGLQAVYRAYKRRERECCKSDPALPGLEHLTNDQVFFLAFANLWCEATDPENIKRIASFDAHSTGRLRVIGSVSNSEDFAKAYNCPTGSPMNPKKKCNIWQ